MKMKNILIFGAGRSGTSMLAGLFSKAGYHMGENLYPGRDTNPKGFFESGEINGLNEDIILFNSNKRRLLNFKKDYNQKLHNGQRWLASFDKEKTFKSNDELNLRIKCEINKAPFCFKDPRFSYTYPLWEPYCGDHVCLIVYRHPAKTIQSMTKEIKSQKYLASYHLDSSKLSEVWVNCYQSILEQTAGNFFFIHYDQVFEAGKLNELSEITRCINVVPFQEKRFDRSEGNALVINDQVLEVYKALKEKSGFDE